jgi:hypothetical protein
LIPAVQGTTESGESTLLIPADQPIEMLLMVHMSRSAVDVLVGAAFASMLETLGGPTYGQVRAGGDPPDIVVDRDGVERGIELTQMADEGRRSTMGRLDVVRAVIDARPKMPHLVGWQINLWAEDLAAPDFLRGHAEEIVDRLRELDPKSHEILLPPGPLPPVFPKIERIVTSRGLSAQAQRLSGPAVPLTRFGSRHGFELGLYRTTQLTRAATIDRLLETVRRKDVEGTDELVITFGAPDHSGFRWPAEVFVFEWLTSLDVPTIETTFIDRVWLFGWDRRIVELSVGRIGG